MVIREIQGRAHTFTLTSGKTFRIFAHETKTVPNSEVSNEMNLAKSMGLILISTNDEVPKNKKSGGTK